MYYCTTYFAQIPTYIPHFIEPISSQIQQFHIIQNNFSLRTNYCQKSQQIRIELFRVYGVGRERCTWINLAARLPELSNCQTKQGVSGLVQMGGGE